jgi:hypothetical protein
MPPSTARVANVLSIPKTPSAIGLPLVSTSLLVSSPASPCCSILTVMPVCLVNAAITSLVIAHESWVAITMVLLSAVLEVLVPHAARTRIDPSATARMALKRVRMTLLRLPSPVLTGAGSRVCG